MADAILHNVKLASLGNPTEGEPAAELVFHKAHVQLEAISGEVGADGQADLEGFWLVVTEESLAGELEPDAIRVRIPMQPEPMRLLCSSVLDWLDKVRVPQGTNISVAGAPEVAYLNRSQRRRAERGKE